MWNNGAGLPVQAAAWGPVLWLGQLAFPALVRGVVGHVARGGLRKRSQKVERQRSVDDLCIANLLGWTGVLGL